MDIIKEGTALGHEIANLGVLTIIAGIFIIGVVVAVSFLLNKLFALYDKQAEVTERQVIALNNSTEATKQNTNIYADTKEMHVKMGKDIEIIKQEMTDLKKDMESIRAKLERAESDRIEMIKQVNDLMEKYNALAISLTDKLDILISKGA